MRRLNQHGLPRLGALAEPPPRSVADFSALQNAGAIVLDCRSPEAYAGGHVPGAINVGIGPSFPTWAGSVLPTDAAVVLVLERASDLWDVCWSLLRIGYDLPRAWLANGIHAWRTSGRPLAFLSQWTAQDLYRELERDPDLVVLDVRQPPEWVDGHLPRARHLTAAQLLDRASEIPTDRPVATICSSGFRSAVCSERAHAARPPPRRQRARGHVGVDPRRLPGDPGRVRATALVAPPVTRVSRMSSDTRPSRSGLFQRAS